MSLLESQLAAIREIQGLWPEAKVVIIGATALGFHFDMSWRQTADVDLAVALTVNALSALSSRPGWRRHPKREHEFTSPGGVRLDVIPAGPELLQLGRLQWLNGDVMSLLGMDLAFKHAVRHGNGVLAAPARVVAVLKMVAFSERPSDRERDLVDIAHLLDAYVKEDAAVGMIRNAAGVVRRSTPLRVCFPHGSGKTFARPVHLRGLCRHAERRPPSISASRRAYTRASACRSTGSWILR